MKKGIFFSLAAISVLSIVGCSTDDIKEKIEEEVGKATYVDSAVEGVKYVCGTQTGFTNENGEFKFEKGASCTFYLDDIKIKEILKENLKDGKEFLEVDLKVAKLLQTLDADGDPSNGITIDKELVQAMIDEGITKIPETDAEIEKFKNVMKAHEVEVKTDADTKSHLIKTAILGKTLYQHCKDDTGEWISEITFNTDGTISINDNGEVETLKFKIEDGFLFTMEDLNPFEKKEVTIKENLVSFGLDKDDIFYFSKTDALISDAVDCSKDKITMNKIIEAFSGQTYYTADKDGFVEKMNFSKDLTSSSWQELVGGNETGTVNISINQNDLTFIITEGNEEFLLKVESIHDNYVEVKVNDIKEIFYKNEKEALEKGSENFKKRFEEKSFYTGEMNKTLEEIIISNKFNTMEWKQIIGGSEEMSGTVSLTVENNNYVVSFESNKDVIEIEFTSIDEEKNFEISIDGEDEKLFFDKEEAKKYYNLI